MPILPFVVAVTSQAERLSVALDFIPFSVHFQSAFGALKKRIIYQQFHMNLLPKNPVFACQIGF